MKDAKGNKKGFYKYLHERQAKENVGSPLNGAVTMVPKKMTKVINVFLASAFTGKTSIQES